MPKEILKTYGIVIIYSNVKHTYIIHQENNYRNMITKAKYIAHLHRYLYILVSLGKFANIGGPS